MLGNFRSSNSKIFETKFFLLEYLVKWYKRGLVFEAAYGIETKDHIFCNQKNVFSKNPQVFCDICSA